MRVNTESVQFKADKKLLVFVEKKLGKLDLYYDRIIDAQVFLRLENSGQVKDKIVEVRLKVPGETLIVKEVHKSFEESIDLAIDALKRQLIRYKEKLHPKHA